MMRHTQTIIVLRKKELVLYSEILSDKKLYQMVNTYKSRSIKSN